MSNKKTDLHKKNHEDDIEMALLKTVYNSVELNFIENLLDENNIPYILKDQGSGGYMRIYSGFSIYGTDIFVEESMFEKAKSIIDEFPLNE
ncbi:DUF2007 domain-containing protein [Schnuerera sp.]|uniref:putative signal transducing protein n=1 Tax=Schnuerera sp. TaxID=2794844 RepID=UPI002BD9DE57|nr:DUF2007 domain-containing protein [Schnuerera sp.]HSH36257.1 DUF2007 domain-containing protein [Schnuerera sp.]